MATIPKPNSIITHINSEAKFSIISINLGGDIKMRCIDKGQSKTFKLGKLSSLDISDLDKQTPAFRL